MTTTDPSAYPESDIRHWADPQEHLARSQAHPVDPAASVEVRWLEADEAEALSLCIWRSYGPSYDADWVYRPDEIAARIRAGTLRSMVGFTADGELVGHVGLTLRADRARVGESGQAVVDKRFRGHHLFTTLKSTMADHVRSEGLLGMYSEVTAAHPYSQRANIALGAKETGILIGYIPADVEYRGVDGVSAHRRSVVLYYLKTNDGPSRAMHPPTRHREVVGRIAERAGLAAHLGDPGEGEPSADPTHLKAHTQEDHGIGIITIHRTGPDLADSIAEHLEWMTAAGSTPVYVDLPLGDPGTRAYGDGLTQAGLRFAGIFPNLDQTGDVLRLQFLGDGVAQTEDIELASDEGARLLSYCIGEHQR